MSPRSSLENDIPSCLLALLPLTLPPHRRPLDSTFLVVCVWTCAHMYATHTCKKLMIFCFFGLQQLLMCIVVRQPRLRELPVPADGERPGPRAGLHNHLLLWVSGHILRAHIYIYAKKMHTHAHAHHHQNNDNNSNEYTNVRI